MCSGESLCGEERWMLHVLWGQDECLCLAGQDLDVDAVMGIFLGGESRRKSIV